MFLIILNTAIAFACCTIALFFLRFWQRTRDHLFACFSLSFFLLGIERMVMLATGPEHSPHIYLVRLFAFLILLYGIYRKNRSNNQ